MTLTVRIIDTDFTTVLGTPTKAVNPPVATHLLNDAGVGTFTTGLDDADLSTIEFGSLFQFLDGATVVFAGRVERQVRERVTSGEEAHEVVHVSGRSLASMLDTAVVFPEGGAGVSQFNDSRIFNAANPSFDDTSWSTDTLLPRQGTNPNASSQYSQPYQDRLLPREWHDPDAYWIGPSNGTYSDAPDGRWYMRWTTPSLSAGDYRLEFAVDNDCLLYIDGVQIGNGGFDYKTMFSKDLTLSAGTHVIYARVYNAPKTGNNPSAFIGSLWSLTDGDLNAVVARTESAATIKTLDTPTVAGANGLAFNVTPPGMTVGEVLDILLTEAQTRGALTGWTWDFTASLDSDLVSWPTVAEIIIQVGDDYLTVLKQLAATYCDFSVDLDGFVLHAYLPGTLGSASGVTYTKGTSITGLTVEGEG